MLAEIWGQPGARPPGCSLIRRGSFSPVSWPLKGWVLTWDGEPGGLVDAGHSGGCGKWSDLGLRPHCLTSVNSSSEKREVVTIQSEVVGSGVYPGTAERRVCSVGSGGGWADLPPLPSWGQSPGSSSPHSETCSVLFGRGHGHLRFPLYLFPSWSEAGLDLYFLLLFSLQSLINNILMGKAV